MRGLLLYELYKLKSAYMKNLTLVAVLYTVLMLAFKTGFLIYMLMWMVVFYAIGSMSMDDGWTRFARALPVSSRTLAGAKFASTGIMLLIGMAYALIMGGILCVMYGGSYVEVVLTVFMLASMVSIIAAIMLPCALKWGVEKARNTLLLAFAALFSVGLLINTQVDLSSIGRWLDGCFGLALAVLIVVAAAACILGWIAMARVYAEKED